MNDTETAVYPPHEAGAEIARLGSGRPAEVAELFSKYRRPLERMVAVRLDRRLYGRVDAADVLQEAYIEIARRIDDYLANPAVSFFVWARRITWQTLLAVHRRHLSQKRDATQEISLHGPAFAGATSVSLAQQLAAGLTSPSQAAMRGERLEQLKAALDTMEATDREVLALRHFEQLDNRHVAQILGIKNTAASNRYVRALRRLGDILASLSDSARPGN